MPPPQLGDQVYQRLGEIAYGEDDQDLALLLWQRALELNPGNDEVRTGLEALKAAPERLPAPLAARLARRLKRLASGLSRRDQQPAVRATSRPSDRPS